MATVKTFTSIYKAAKILKVTPSYLYRVIRQKRIKAKRNAKGRWEVIGGLPKRAAEKRAA